VHQRIGMQHRQLAPGVLAHPDHSLTAA
jgi:hypothetical protein